MDNRQDQMASPDVSVLNTQEDPALWPVEGGGNFVDCSLKVKVKQAPRTLMAFRPEYQHGTTRLCGAHSMGCVILFCTHLLYAYKRAMEGTSVESGAGAGHGSNSET